LLDELREAGFVLEEKTLPDGTEYVLVAAPPALLMATAESTSCYVPVARFFKTPCMGPCGRDDCGSCRYETIYCTVSKRSLSAEEQKSLYSDDGHNDVLKDDAIVERMRTIKLCPECYDDKLFDAPGVRFEHFVIKGRRAGAGGGGEGGDAAEADARVLHVYFEPFSHRLFFDPEDQLIPLQEDDVQFFRSSLRLRLIRAALTMPKLQVGI